MRRKIATSVRLSPELLRRVREMIAATREAASVTEVIEIALEDWLEDREAELEARNLPSSNGPVSDLPGPVQLGPFSAKAEAVAWWLKEHPEQAAAMLFRPEVDWRAMNPRAAELYDMLSTLPGLPTGCAPGA
jgi:Arc/MetJ-type ribon-helix-helix transcriptional regulator